MRAFALVATLLVTALVPSRANADSIFIGSVTCIPGSPAAASCLDPTPGTTSRWRVVNFMGQLFNPTPGSDDWTDVSLEFRFEGGTLSWHWDVVPENTMPGEFVEAEFPSALLPLMTSLSLTATLPRTVFDPVFRFNEFLMFTAEGSTVFASTTSFPPPLDISMHGTFEEKPIPEPGTIALVALGLAGLARGARRRRRAA